RGLPRPARGDARDPREDAGRAGRGYRPALPRMRIDVDGPLHAAWMSRRTALVTGGGGRADGPGTVGWAISRLLARHGAAVVVLDRDAVAAHRTVSQIRAAGGTAIPVIADVTIDDDCARAVAEARRGLGGLDTLVNNVAAWSPAELFDVEPEEF